MSLTIKSLHIYPVKGLKGIDLAEGRATDRGLQHDRRWMVVDGDGEFLTQREYPKMATVWTDLTPDALLLSAPDADEVSVPLAATGKPVKVRVWRSTVDAVPASPDADRFLTEYLGLPCRLVFMPDSTRRMSNPDYAGKGKLVGFADGYAYLVTNDSSLADLNTRLTAKGHAALPMNRFRPNIVVEGAAPYAEDDWHELHLGEAVIRAAKPCGRCQVTTTDQTTGHVRGPEPLATLATYRDSHRFGVMFGMNMVTVRGGRVRVGDSIDARKPA
jgi:uncharacterized protein YcbX